MDIARIHIRFHGANTFIRGKTMINWVMNFTTFGQYKRMWWPVRPFAEFAKLDGERINILKSCMFVTVTTVGIGLAGITGHMDDTISSLGLPTVICADMPKLMKYARDNVDPQRAEIAFLTAFTSTADENGEIKYVLQGVVHTDARLIPAIEQI